MMQDSRCFGLVNRGAAMQNMRSERAFADEGELQKGSKMGGGQIKAADYTVIPNIVHKDRNSSGQSALGGLGGMIGGTFGAAIGGFSTTAKEAQVTLEVVDIRTSESMIVEGSATKKDLKAGGFGWLGSMGGALGGYDDTDLGKVVAIAFVDAYNNLVGELGGIVPGSAAAADNAGFVVSTNVKMRGGPTTKAPELAMLYEGTSIIKTGVENGEWVEIEAMGKTGWIKAMYITR
jgi:curli biogenesis system outer membrane secretion channel CsgG